MQGPNLDINWLWRALFDHAWLWGDRFPLEELVCYVPVARLHDMRDRGYATIIDEVSDWKL
jgi:hypothetical protein